MLVFLLPKRNLAPGETRRQALGVRLRHGRRAAQDACRSRLVHVAARGTAAAKVGFGFLPQDRRSSCEGAAVAADVLQFLAGSEPSAMAGAGMASPSPMAARSSAILPATLERTFGNRNSESTATTHSTAVAT